MDLLVRESELVAWGRQVGAEAAPPLFLALSGPLGAGKSVLARAIARGAGVEGPVPSPTFALLLRHPARGGRAVVHLDLYRIEDTAELGELAWEELGAPDELVLVEWAERAGDWLPPDRWDVRLSPVAGDAALRRLEVTRVGRPGDLPSPTGVGRLAGDLAADGEGR